MSGATTTTHDGKTTLTLHLQTNGTAEEVWRSITDPGALSGWWPMQVREVPLEVGAPLRFFDEEGGTSEGEVLEVVPGQVFAFADDGGNHRVKFEVFPSEPGARIRFSHTFPANEPADQHTYGWNLVFSELLERLKARGPSSL